MKRFWLWAAFGAYCLLMVWLLFGQRMAQLQYADYALQLQENINLLPLDTVRRFLWVLRNSDQPGLHTHAIVNLFGNVAMFVPLGVLLPLLWEKLRRFRVFLPTTLAVIVGIELVQLVTLLGKCDVDDLLLNLVGVAIGFAISALLTKLQKN